MIERARRFPSRIVSRAMVLRPAHYRLFHDRAKSRRQIRLYFARLAREVSTIINANRARPQMAAVLE
jgi:hypothetical protein